MKFSLVLTAVIVIAIESVTGIVNLTVSPGLNVALGENVTYTCSTSEEDLTVNWIINENLATIFNSPYVFVDDAAGAEPSSVLILTGVLAFNSSTIICVTSSGSATNVTLRIQGKPNPPTNLTTEYDGICSVRVIWSPPFTLEGVPLFYGVTITDVNTAVTVLSENVSDAMYIFSPVNLNTTYAVNIAAWNSAGFSEQTSSFVSFSGAVNTNISNLRRNGSVWLFEYGLTESCKSGVVSGATVAMCPSTKVQPTCFSSSVTGTDIQQLDNGGLRVPISALIPEDMIYGTSISVLYEGGQELYSSFQSQIMTFDIMGLSILNVSAGIVCFSVEKVEGSSFYATYIELHDAHKIIKSVVVLESANEVCIEGLTVGKYGIYFGEVNVARMTGEVEIHISNSDSRLSTSFIEATQSCSPHPESKGMETLIAVTAVCGTVIVILLTVLTAIIIKMCLKKASSCKQQDENRAGNTELKPTC